MSRHPFDAGYTPPAPVLPITLIGPDGDRTEVLNALADTGADVSLVPTAHLRQIAAPVAAEAMVRTPWGERHPVIVYLADILVTGTLLPSVYVIGDDLGSEVILGRDVLNRLRLFIDGPAGYTEVLPE